MSIENPTSNETNESKINLESPEAISVVRNAVQSAFLKIEGIETIFNSEGTSQKPFSGVNYKVWSEFLSEVFRICREQNLLTPFQISIDKENHKVLGVIFIGPNAEEILVPYLE